MKQLLKQQKGAASIFIVIFFALLISVITLSFMRITGTGQEAARNTDLSQSAYDSASAGVEDAKRALNLYYQNNCEANPGGSPVCGPIAAQFDKKDCAALSNLAQQLPGMHLKVNPGTEPEVQVQQGDSDQKYNQAYTCANIDFKTDDYIRQIAAGNSDLIPLKAVGTFNIVQIHWFRAEDAASQNDPFTLRNSKVLPKNNPSSPWGGNTPALIRVQLIPFSGDAAQINNNSRALFLVPAQNGDVANNNIDFVFDGARNTSANPPNISAKNVPLAQPILVKCNTSGEYACTANLRLPSSGENYYLRVTAFYNKTTFNLQLYNGSVSSDVVQFDGVEPSVDITGRANDVFRRVVTRLAPNDLTQNGLANLGFDSETGICKTFYFGLRYTYKPEDNCPK